MKTREKQMSLDDRLLDLTADLLSERVFEASLKRLFADAPGKWLSWIELQSGLDTPGNSVRAIEQEAGCSLMVAWIDHPQSIYGDGYVTVHFFAEAISWWTTALYNKRRLFVSEVKNGTPSGRT